MIAHLTLAPLTDGRELIDEGRAVCAMRGQARDYWPVDLFDEELRALLKEERDGSA